MKIYTLVFLTLFTTILLGQSLAPEIVTTSGFQFENRSVKIDWTIGQITVETLSSNDLHITQGFQQPVFILTSIGNQKPIPGISVYPNPTGKYLNIEFIENLHKNITLLLSDLTGRILLKKEYDTSDVSSELDLSNFSNALYLLTLRQNDSGYTTIFKIIKNCSQ